MGKSTPKEQIPALLAFWGSLIHTLPAVNIGGLNFSVTIVGALFLTAVRFTAEYAMVAVFGWPAGNTLTQEAAAGVAAISHSSSLVPGLWMCFRSHPYRPSEKMADAPGWWQDAASALIQFCTGYMLYDAAVNILWQRRETGLTSDDLLFLAHHVVTILYMISTRIVCAGQQSAMMCMLLGECTNPLHNSFFIGEKAMQLACCNGPMAQQVFRAIEIVFSFSYVAVRGLIAPLFFAPMTWDLWARGRKHIPIWLVFFWTLLIWSVLIGSWPWTVECWGVLTKLPAEMGFVEAARIDKEL